MVWPQALVKELAARRCIIFLGAGASAGSSSSITTSPYKNPPTWGALLEKLIDLMKVKSDEILIREFIKTGKFLDAAEVIMRHVSPADYTGYLRDSLDSPKYKASKIHEQVFKIDPKVVITTNFDDIYDNYCKQGNSTYGYNICRYYDSHLVSDLRSPIRSVIKAHGCISNPSLSILTRSQFFEARAKYPNFYKVLDSLFITNTILFIGYSLNDPDIQLVLENSNIVTQASHPHYIAIGNDIHPAIKESIYKAYNIEFIEFVAGDYAELETGLSELASDVEGFRVSNLL